MLVESPQVESPRSQLDRRRATDGGMMLDSRNHSPIAFRLLLLAYFLLGRKVREPVNLTNPLELATCSFGKDMARTV